MSKNIASNASQTISIRRHHCQDLHRSSDPFWPQKKKIVNGGGPDSVDLLSREDRSGINGRGGAKCSCQRRVVDSDVNAEVDMNGV